MPAVLDNIRSLIGEEERERERGRGGRTREGKERGWEKRRERGDEKGERSKGEQIVYCRKRSCATSQSVSIGLFSQLTG